MDLVNSLREKVEPSYLEGEEDVKENRVCKAVKLFTEQVRKAVEDMKDSLVYQSGREYSKKYVPKGKAKRGIEYVREKRNKDNVPESRAKIKKFIRDQNRKLQRFINETEESPMLETYLEEVECVEVETDAMDGEPLLDTDCDSEEEYLAEQEEELEEQGAEPEEEG